MTCFHIVTHRCAFWTAIAILTNTTTGLTSSFAIAWALRTGTYMISDYRAQFITSIALEGICNASTGQRFLITRSISITLKNLPVWRFRQTRTGATAVLSIVTTVTCTHTVIASAMTSANNYSVLWEIRSRTFGRTSLSREGSILTNTLVLSITFFHRFALSIAIALLDISILICNESRTGYIAFLTIIATRWQAFSKSYPLRQIQSPLSSTSPCSQSLSPVSCRRRKWLLQTAKARNQTTSAFIHTQQDWKKAKTPESTHFARFYRFQNTGSVTHMQKFVHFEISAFFFLVMDSEASFQIQTIPNSEGIDRFLL